MPPGPTSPSWWPTTKPRRSASARSRRSGRRRRGFSKRRAPRYDPSVGHSDEDEDEKDATRADDDVELLDIEEVPVSEELESGLEAFVLIDAGDLATPRGEPSRVG